MMMEMELNEKKAKENHIDIDECYAIVDKYFKENGVEIIDKGVYKGDKKDFGIFVMAQWDLPQTDWFLKIVDKWYFRYEGDTIEYREDSLASYYRVEARNADFIW